MPVCITYALKVSLIAADAFTLAWTHTVEKTAWEEDWRRDGAELVLVEARIKGSGAGMEPPEGARLVDGWWRYSPTDLRVPELRLADLGGPAGRWRVCAEGACTEIAGAHDGAAPIVIAPCKDASR